MLYSSVAAVFHDKLFISLNILNLKENEVPMKKEENKNPSFQLFSPIKICIKSAYFYYLKVLLMLLDIYVKTINIHYILTFQY